MPHPTSLAVMADCLRRRAGAIALTLTIGLVIALNLALAQKPLFSARETLRIAPPKVAAGMVATTVSVPMAQQVPLLRDRVLAPDVLEDIVRAYELFLDVPESPLAERGARLREAVRIDFLPDGTLAVSAELADPEAARLVAQELSHRLIHESASQRIAETKATLRFLQAEEARRRTAVETLQAEIEATAPDTRAPDLPVQVIKTELESLAFVLVRIERDRAALDPEGGAAPRDAGRAAALDRQRAALRDRQSRLAAELDARTEAEARRADQRHALSALSGDLAETAALRARAEAGYRLEMRRQSERLIVTAPAEAPSRPSRDWRLATLLGVMALALLAAALVVATLERHAPALRTARAMRRLTGIDPIATIPTAAPPRSKRQKAA